MEKLYFRVESLYFSPSKKKFIFLYFITSGLYSIYWVYRNWKIIKENRELKISYLFRSLFFIFYSYSFFKHVSTSAKEKGCQKQVDPVLLCVFYTFFQLTSIVFLPLGATPFAVILDYICIGFSIIPFLAILELMGFYNSVISSAENKEADNYTKYEIFVIAAGMLITLSEIFQLFGKFNHI